MALGSLRTLTGRSRASDLGGLARLMPATAALVCVASLSIAGAPLTAGFASLALVFDAFAQAGRPLVYFTLVAAIGAAVAHTAVKIPYAAFFAPARRPHPEAPMFASPQLAMLFAAALIIGVGIAPRWLYAFLPPDPVRFSPYDWGRLVTHVQLGVSAALAVAAARMARLYPVEKPGDLRDVDRLIHGALWSLVQRAGTAGGGLHRMWRGGEQRSADWLSRIAGSWVALADRPTRRLASDGVWLLAVLGGFVILCLVFAWGVR
jgi:NADH:ubiquinone oxidoreductase subunit 5 (subunit L)/multisubunit Na+/H+ antiporter MnhA subunit